MRAKNRPDSSSLNCCASVTLQCDWYSDVVTAAMMPGRSAQCSVRMWVRLSATCMTPVSRSDVA